MKTRWTHEPPKEPGWYWCSNYGRLMDAFAWLDPWPRLIRRLDLEDKAILIDEMGWPVEAEKNRLWSTTQIDRPDPPTDEEMEE